MTPADTPDRTASVKRRRSSDCACVARISERCALRSTTIELKRLRQGAQVAFRAVERNGGRQIALAHTVRRADQPADRHHQAVGDAQPRPDGRQQHRQAKADVKRGEAQLERASVALQGGVVRRDLLHQGQRVQHLRVHGLRGVQHHARTQVEQRRHHADHAGIVRRDDRRRLVAGTHGRDPCPQAAQAGPLLPP